MKTTAVSPAVQLHKIDNYQYTLSLINQGSKAGLLRAGRVEEIQAELMILLSEAIPKYTRHESNSVPTETAQSLTQSLLYNIDNYLRSLAAPEQALKTLNTSTLADCYTQGINITKDMFQRTKELWFEVQTGILPVPLRAYTETIASGFDEFFYRYDVNYGAHLAEVSIDYPLLFDDMKWTGVIYVKNYLRALKLENKLCGSYPNSQLSWLLQSCGRQFKLPSSDLMVNLTDLVLRNSLAAILLGREARAIKLTAQDCWELTRLFQELSSKQTLSRIQEAMTALLEELNLTDPDLHRYLQPYPSMLSSQLLSAVKENSLDGVIQIEQETKQNSLDSRYYIPGEKLSDEQLRLIIEALGYCKDGSKKVEFVTARIRNVEDLLEILGAYRFYGQEFILLFDELGDHELALLAKHIQGDLEDDSTPDANFSWQINLQKYLQHCPERAQRVTRIAEEILQ